MVHIICPVDCGNAPKKNLLKEFNIAFAKHDIDFMSEHITDDIVWNKVGIETMMGKEAFVESLEQMKQSKVKQLQINTIITHGKTASADGVITMENNTSYAFSDVYIFNSSAKHAKIKEMTSYVIKL